VPFSFADPDKEKQQGTQKVLPAMADMTTRVADARETARNRQPDLDAGILQLILLKGGLRGV
jgi:hypothetical protein